MHVGALLDRHQHLTQHPGTKVRHDHRNARKPRRDDGKRQRIAEAEIEWGRQAEFLSDANRQDAAVHEYGCPPIGGGREHFLYALVIQPVPVHGWKQADSPKLLLPDRACQPCPDLSGRGIEHEEADEPRRVTADGGGDGVFVAGNARDNRHPRDAVPIELGDPAVGQFFGSPWILPAQAMRYCRMTAAVRKSRDAGGQQLEKSAREKMTMRVANPHGEKAIIIGLVSDTHGLVRDSLFEALRGVSQILHAGDVGGRTVLDALSAIAPVLAVCGNVDPFDGALPQQIAIDVGGLSIHVSHGDELGNPTPGKLLTRYSADVLVFGHTHRPLVERDGNRLVVNPGAAGPRRFDLKPSVARLTILGGRAEVELVTLGG
jgi:uncharacterized protein